MNYSMILLFFLSLLNFKLITSVSSLKIEKILNGEKVSAGKFKYTCILYLPRILQCTCAILHDYFVVTSAHCVTRVDSTIHVSQWRVSAGFVDLNKIHESVFSDVEKIYVHKDYQRIGAHLDIAILELHTSLKVDKNGLKILRVPEKNNPIYTRSLNTEVYLAGFGWDYAELKFDPKTKKNIVSGKHISKTLNYIKVQLFESDTECCNKDSVMCARTEWKENELTKGLCKGDSGTVIEVEGYALAIASSGSHLDHNKLYQITKFTKLGPHYQMIYDIMHHIPNSNVNSAVMPLSSVSLNSKLNNLEIYSNKKESSTALHPTKSLSIFKPVLDSDACTPNELFELC